MNNRLEILEDRHEDKILARALDKSSSSETSPTLDSEESEEVVNTKSTILDPDYLEPNFRRKRSLAIDFTSNKWGHENFENNSDLDFSPLELAITNHHILIAMNFLTQIFPAFYKIILFNLAVKHGCLEIVKFMIKDKWHVNDFTVWNKFTPLIIASIYNQRQIAATLIAFGADIEHQDRLGQTPLMYAAMNCNIKITKLLIDLGANIFAKDNNGHNILDLLKQETLTTEKNKKTRIIHTYLLDYLTSHTKYAHKINNRDIFNYSMSEHLMLKLKGVQDYFPKEMSHIIFSYLDTKKMWLLWSLSSYQKVSPKPAYTPSMLNTIQAHADVTLFAMPSKQREEKDSVTKKQLKRSYFGENPR